MQLEIRNAVREYDVIVVGGGPAGCAAAIAAARQGANTLIIETGSALGGMATLGLVSKWAPLSDKEKIIYRSVALEIVTRYKKKANIPDAKWDWIPLFPEDLKLVYDEMIEECGAKVIFESRVCDSVVKDGKIDTLIVANKNGLTPYKAKTYIDCTGDADVAAYSGVPFEMGDENGTVQPGSLCFIIGNVKLDRLEGGKLPNSNPSDGIWARICRENKYPLVCKHFIPAVIGENTVFANAGHLFDVDSTDNEAVSAALVKGRRIAAEYLAALKEYMPEAFSDALIVATAPSYGTRESRRIRGEYTLTLEDYQGRRSFHDEIGRNCYWIDCHGASKSMSELVNRRFEKGESHGIPWRCMIPQGIDNLLVAGRSISMERVVLASVRVMPNCLAMGEAAGLGAAIAASKGIGVRAIDVKDVQAKIKNDPVILV